MKRGLIDIKLVDDLFAQRIIWYCENFVNRYAQEFRELANDPTLYDSIEYLYNQMKQRQQATVIST